MEHQWRAYIWYKVGKRRGKWYHTEWYSLGAALRWLADSMEGWAHKPNVDAVGTVVELDPWWNR